METSIADLESLIKSRPIVKLEIIRGIYLQYMFTDSKKIAYNASTLSSILSNLTIGRDYDVIGTSNAEIMVEGKAFSKRGKIVYKFTELGYKAIADELLKGASTSTLSQKIKIKTHYHPVLLVGQIPIIGKSRRPHSKIIRVFTDKGIEVIENAIKNGISPTIRTKLYEGKHYTSTIVKRREEVLDYARRK